MPGLHSKSNYGERFKRRQKLKIIGFFGVSALIITGIVFFLVGRTSDISGREGGNGNKDLVKLWQEGAFLEVFNMSEQKLEKKPLDFFLLMIHGFSAYQIAIAQMNDADRLPYIDRAIWALRKARLTHQGENDARVKYALGRAYYYKGPSYADLCVKYLKEARTAYYNAEDIPQYLGLAYALLHDYRNSVIAFTDALDPKNNPKGPSDILLLAIARSYIELSEFVSARPYIVKALNISKDFNTIAAARLLLASIMMEEGDSAGAEKEIRSVISEGGESAEAHFRLGLLYEKQNDYYRARAEWRKAFNLNPNFTFVREKLNL
ncbi:MAG: tetratricopeptide repeat protein [Spirochaetaceae bacterium]|jgi:tetratricopeptide (TPR) repeat protein|nr:tetratricopeptide repeat protein [Spirochaetaceae bacterium]